MKAFHILYLCTFSILMACAPSRFIEPLEKKQLAIGASAGGPLIGYGSLTIPVPLSSVEVGYGLDTNLTLHGAIHTTSLLFGNFHMDAGATYKIVDQKKHIPNLSINPGFNFIYSPSMNIAKFWPNLDFNAYWNYSARKHYFYLGVNNMFELSKTMANEQPQKQRWLLNPQLGHVFKSKHNHFHITTELKFLGFPQSNAYSFVPYNSLSGDLGATGIYLGLRYLF